LRKLHWFWHPHDEASLKSIDDLVESYENAVGMAGSGCLAWLLMIAVL
jgi:alpha-L-fucosidase